MYKITRAQRVALKAVYDRGPIFETIATAAAGCKPLTYRQFRKRAQSSSYDPCIMVHWCGMWLGIEQDGYTHS